MLGVEETASVRSCYCGCLWSAEQRALCRGGGQPAQVSCPKPFDLNESQTASLCECLFTWRQLGQTAELAAGAFLRGAEE